MRIETRLTVVRGVSVAGLLVTVGLAVGAVASAGGRSGPPPQLTVFRDEDVSVRFRRPVRPNVLDSGAFRLATEDGRDWNGSLVLGTFIRDAVAARRVVVRPEAVREYYQLVRDLSREDAQRKADRLLARLERTGRLGALDEIDRGLRGYFGVATGVGTRLDDSVGAAYPPTITNPVDPKAQYRALIAGDDNLWGTYVGGDIDAFDAFARLEQNSEWERFYHPIDQETGLPASQSVLRSREHRRVLVHRNRRTVTFVPDLPEQQDLSDLAIDAGEAVGLELGRALRGARWFETAVTAERTSLRDGAPTFTMQDGADQFVSPDARGLAESPPRIVNATPPYGEVAVDPTTDWEDPDNAFAVAESARRDFVVRLRFAQPLDPRTVTAANFEILRTQINPGTPEVVDVLESVAVTVRLTQSRLGEVRVDVTPVQNLDPRSRYEARVRGPVRGLGGTYLDHDYVAAFETR